MGVSHRPLGEEPVGGAAPLPGQGGHGLSAVARSRFAPSRGSLVLTVAAAASVALLAAAARTPGAIRDALWEDELASAHVLIKSTPWGMLRQVARTEATPPLWYALGWLAHEAGVSPQGFRALSVLAGALLAGATVLVAFRLLALWASALAGVLVAFGWQFVMHGRELRSYELFALLTVAFAWVLLRERDRTHDPATGWRRYALAIAVAAASLTNYFFLLSAAAAAAWLWFDPELRVARARLLKQMGIGLIPLAVWSPVLVHQYLGQRFTWIGAFTVRGVVNVYWELFSHHVPPGLAGDLLPLALLIAILVGCALLARGSAEGRLLALLALTPVALSSLAWLGGAHIFDPRNLIAAGPFAAMALAALVSRLPRGAGYCAAVATCVLMTGAVIAAERTPPTPYDRVSGLLVRQGWTARDPIVLFGTFGDFFAYRSPLEWYLPRQPQLTLGEPLTGASCPAIYVLAQSAPVSARIMRSGLVFSSATAGSVFVARLRAREPPSHGLWRAGHILAARGAPACVELIPESQIIARLEH